MNNPSTLFIGLDVHKETTDVAYSFDNNRDAPHYHGTIPTNIRSINKLIKHLHPKASQLCVVYEAGPCGFWLYRHLLKHNIDCWVVSPSLIPKAPGDKIKTDRRDAIALANVAASGMVSPIHVPNAEDEAVRDLVRCREDAMIDLRQARQRLKSFLLRNGHPCSGRNNWNDAYKRHLADIHFLPPAKKIAYQDYINTVEERQQRLHHIEQALEVVAKKWCWFPLVQFLTTLRGIRFISAMTLVAELGDMRRFNSPRSLMHFIGLTPSEYSSGQRQKQGGITKCGNTHARRILIEAAWAYRFSPKVSRELLKRQEGHSPKLVKRSWEAQLRLCRRF
ncbi:IS110 family transposase, partial [Motilimonas pumila]